MLTAKRAPVVRSHMRLIDAQASKLLTGIVASSPTTKSPLHGGGELPGSQPNLTSLHLARQSLRHDAEAFPHPARHFPVTPPTPPIRNPGLPAPPHPVPCRPPLNPVPLPYVHSLYKPRATEDGWLRPRNPRQGHEIPLPCGNLSRRARHGIGTSLGSRHQSRSHAESSQPLKAPCSGQTKPRFSRKVSTGQPPSRRRCNQCVDIAQS